jgi:hypothetical protein
VVFSSLQAPNALGFGRTDLFFLPWQVNAGAKALEQQKKCSLMKP